MKISLPQGDQQSSNQDSEWQKETMLIKRCQDSESLRAREPEI